MNVSIIVAIISMLISLATFLYNGWKNYEREVHDQADSVATWLTEQISDSVRGWSDRPLQEVVLYNKSRLPVYDVVLSSGVIGDKLRINTESVCIDGDSIITTFITVLPPGTFRSYVIPPDLGMCKRFQAVIAFRDAQGHCWVRDANGKLQRLQKGLNTFTAMNHPLPPPNSVPLEPLDQ